MSCRFDFQEVYEYEWHRPCLFDDELLSALCVWVDMRWVFFLLLHIYMKRKKAWLEEGNRDAKNKWKVLNKEKEK